MYVSRLESQQQYDTRSISHCLLICHREDFVYNFTVTFTASQCQTDSPLEVEEFCTVCRIPNTPTNIIKAE